MAGAGFGGLLLICLLNLTLNKKSSSHSLQFVSKYHVFLDSLRAQIREYTYHNSVTAALYYAGVELEKNVTYTQRTENKHTEKAIAEATLIPWIAGLSGPIGLTLE